LAQRFGYPPLFVISAIMGLGALIVSLRYLPSPKAA
jgi:hypothetical protein